MNALLRLSDVQRTQDRGASFPSIEDIFLHIVDNNLWWFESVPGNRQAEHQRPLGPLSPQQLRALTRRIARIDRTFSASLTPQGLRRRIVVNGIGGDGQPYRMTVSLRTVVWHLIEEELQHRGEMNALFWQLDVEAPTDAWFSSRLAR